MRGLDYVAIDPAVADDPRIALVARRIERDRHWVVGHLPQFLGAVAVHACDGDLGEIDDDLLDQWAGGVPGWGQAVRRYLCEESGVLRAWHKYNGRALERLARDRSRKNRDRHSSDPPRNGDGHSEEVPRTVRGQSKDYTVTDTVTKQHQHDTARASWSEARLREHLPQPSWADLRTVLVGSGEGRDGAARAIAAMAGLDPQEIPATPGMKTCSVDEMAAVLSRIASSKQPRWHQRLANRCLDSVREDSQAATAASDPRSQGERARDWAAGRE